MKMNTKTLSETNYKRLNREQRGQIIAQKYHITKTKNGDYKVPSQFNAGSYTVKMTSMKEECDCPDYELRKCKCKHIFAVEYILNHEIKIDSEGNMTVTQTQTVRKTYTQQWKQYNSAQQSEKAEFMRLLADLTNNIVNPVYTFGRPRTALSDVIYTMIYKVYNGFSGRRFATDMNIAIEKGYLQNKIPYNTMFDYFQKKELTPLLVDMVRITSLPLKDIETKSSTDGTGFGTSVYERWFSYKYGKEITGKKWIKCNFINGVKTNIITSVDVTAEYVHESPAFKRLVKETAENFKIEEISGDKAYSGRNNLKAVEEFGGLPFIAFKENATERPIGATIWKKMYHYYQYRREEYLQHYHLRSNAETTVMMMKTKCGGSIRSKKWESQVNETLCKVITHNICCVITSMHELGINGDFTMEGQNGLTKSL